MLKDIFGKKKNIVIGAVHFPPLLGNKDFPGFKTALANALADLSAFEKGDADAIFLENNYGFSSEFVDTPVTVSMAYLIGELRKKTSLPLGASVLWNDYKTALALAKTYSLQFIRVPVFVDDVKTYCGIIKGAAKNVARIRTEIGAQKVAILADVHVKHATLLSRMDLVASAKKAIKEGADALILTGTWTGVSPELRDIERVRDAVGRFPLFVGSGANVHNVQDLCLIANGVIVSTSLKRGGAKRGERNVKGYTQRIDKQKVLAFTKRLKRKR